jgi:hypothetical protein
MHFDLMAGSGGMPGDGTQEKAKNFGSDAESRKHSCQKGKRSVARVVFAVSHDERFRPKPPPVPVSATAAAKLI